MKVKLIFKKYSPGISLDRCKQQKITAQSGSEKNFVPYVLRHNAYAVFSDFLPYFSVTKRKNHLYILIKNANMKYKTKEVAMEKTKKEQLEALGIDVDSALTRFMGLEALFAKSLSLFIADTSIETLKAAMQANDLEKAYAAAHTIKGVCGNLSMDGLYSKAAELCTLLTAKNGQAAQEKFPSFIQEYDNVLEGIKKWI